MHHGTCVMHAQWCMSGSLTCGGGENVPGIPCACATRNFTYLVRGPLQRSPHGLPHGARFTACNPPNNYGNAYMYLHAVWYMRADMSHVESHAYTIQSHSFLSGIVIAIDVAANHRCIVLFWRELSGIHKDGKLTHWLLGDLNAN